VTVVIRELNLESSNITARIRWNWAFDVRKWAGPAYKGWGREGPEELA